MFFFSDLSFTVAFNSSKKTIQKYFLILSTSNFSPYSWHIDGDYCGCDQCFHRKHFVDAIPSSYTFPKNELHSMECMF